MTDATNVLGADQLPAGSSERPRIARFGVYEVDLRTAELRRSGVKVRLQEQPFRLLSLLLQRAGDVVTREELRDRLWPSEFVDFDHSLNTAVRKLREALDDSAEHPRFIETLARRGYRFVASVSWVEATAPPTRHVFRWIALSALAIFMIGAAVAYLTLGHRQVRSGSAIDTVAVLPFTSDDRGSEYLSDGMTEMLIDSLSRLPHLRVMARTTAFRYKGKSVDPQEAGRALNVGAVVVGNLRRERDRYAIHVEMIDVHDGTQLWGDEFESSAASLSLVQERISRALSDQLRQGVGRQQHRLLTSDPEAYELYLKGLHAWNQRGREDLERSIEYFNRVIERDPHFADAYAGLANTYGVMVGYGTIPVVEGTAKIIAAAERALQLDPNNASALVSLATTKYRNLWDFAGADRDYRRALTLNPNYATGHQWYADELRSMGRWAEARREIDLAYKLDPLSPPINAAMCYSLYQERRYREAIAFSRRVSQLDVRFGAPFCQAASFFALGDINEAVSMAGKSMGPPLHGYGAMMAKTFSRDGARAFFHKNAEELAQVQNAGGIDQPVAIAAMYAKAGDNDAAFAWLERAYEKRVSRLTDVNIDPMFDSLHSDPRFDRLLRRIGLPRVEPPAH